MLPKTAHPTSATLLVRELEAVLGFYRDVVGLEILRATADSATLGDQGTPLLYLEKHEALPYPADNQAGLYHLAFLFSHPSRLAKAIEHIGTIAPSLYQGSSDHLVSQAFYMSDPEGNGVELYVDRPRETWEYKDGQIVMGSLPLNPNSFHAEHSSENLQGNISLGHVHLKVGDIAQAAEFYSTLLGFDVVFSMPTALFVSAGGYHHHLGLNTWESLGAGKRPKSLGLKQFELRLFDTEAFAILQKKLISSDIQITTESEGIIIEDPWGIKLHILP
jgi:catechol 2,3-dioxygenase